MVFITLFRNDEFLPVEGPTSNAQPPHLNAVSGPFLEGLIISYNKHEIAQQREEHSTD